MQEGATSPTRPEEETDETTAESPKTPIKNQDTFAQVSTYHTHNTLFIEYHEHRLELQVPLGQKK